MAAAGLFAIENIQSLKIDHDNASFVAEKLRTLGIPSLLPVDTNMIWLDLKRYGTFDRLSQIAATHNVNIVGGGTTGRLVFHRDINQNGIELLMKSIYEFIKTSKKQ